MRRAVQEATLLITVVLLALVVWFVIADTENREIEARLGFSLQVEVRELGTDLVVAGEPLPVTVTVVGREADVESRAPRAFPRKHFATQPTRLDDIVCPCESKRLEGDVRVRAVQPETAVVILQETVEREVPVHR